MCRNGGIFLNLQAKKSLINVEESTFFLVASLANPSLLQEKEKDKPMKDTSGPKCSESFAKLNPSGCWEKTSGGFSQLTLDGRLEEYSQTWPKAGIVLDGYAMELVMSARRTKGKGCSLWLTPCAYDTGERTRSEEALQRRKEYRESIGRKTVPPGTLSEQILTKEQESATNMWPTPHSTCSTGPGKQGRQGGENLQTAVQGQLNPAWVECLMGFPAGWTELNGPQDQANNTLGSRQELQQG
jgi:hypothetical protein